MEASWWLLGIVFVVGFVLGRVSRGGGDRYVGQAPGAQASRVQPASDAEIDALVAGGQTIEAIKAYRERYGVGLKEAKDAIDALRARRG
ncbi:MAG TPA: hypothetical protein VFY12_04705 [Arenimonas sp.]|nr:hypothetical protein [Arenimonas sp.]